MVPDITFINFALKYNDHKQNKIYKNNAVIYFGNFLFTVRAEVRLLLTTLVHHVLTAMEADVRGIS